MDFFGKLRFLFCSCEEVASDEGRVGGGKSVNSNGRNSAKGLILVKKKEKVICLSFKQFRGSLYSFSRWRLPSRCAQPRPRSHRRRQSTRPEQAKALEDWTYAVALDAANWGSPAVIMYNLRANDAVGPKPKAAPNTIWRMEDISTPQLSVEAGYVTPNVDVIYGFGFLDLGPEPVILTVPDSKGRYYVVEIVDMYSNAFAYAGGTATGYKGGKFALVGPGFKGDTSRRRPTDRLPDALDADSAARPRRQPGGSASGHGRSCNEITVQGLAKFTGQPAPAAPVYNYAVPKVTDAKQPASAMNFTDPLQFWEIFSDVINENPPPKDQVTAVLPNFEPLGIKLGKRGIARVWIPSCSRPWSGLPRTSGRC